MTAITYCDRCGKVITGDQRGPLQAKVTRVDSGALFRTWDLHVACFDALNTWMVSERHRLLNEQEGVSG